MLQMQKYMNLNLLTHSVKNIKDSTKVTQYIKVKKF